jgi:MerR family transcriptional regulator, heat shock protein HspR
MTQEQRYDDEPCYVISVAAKLVDLHPQRLRYYDRIGLLRPSRTAGRIRLYSQRDIETLRKISRLTEDLGVNLAGVEVVMNMSRRIQELQRQMEQMQRQASAEIEMLRCRIQELETDLQTGTEVGPAVIEVLPALSAEQEESQEGKPEGK